MTIEKLNASKVLISLCGEDMQNFRLNIGEMSFCNERSRRILLRLLQLACKEAGVDSADKAVLMEALPLKSGCLLLVTFSDKSKKRTYKVKRIKDKFCYVFDDTENLLCAAEALYRRKCRSQKNSLWLYEDRYYAMFEYPLTDYDLRSVLKTFAKEKRLSTVDISRICEGGRLICADNALSIIGEKICIKEQSRE